MTYVDLNPIRAGLCETLEESEHTSVQERVRAYVRSQKQRAGRDKGASSRSGEAVSDDVAAGKEKDEPATLTAPLAAFTGTTGHAGHGLPFHFSDYMELVDWTGWVVRADKRGQIPGSVPPILQRLGVEAGSWIDTVRHFRRHFYDYVGPPETMERCSRTLGRSWLRGVGARRKLWGGAAMARPLSESRRKTN